MKSLTALSLASVIGVCGLALAGEPASKAPANNTNNAKANQPLDIVETAVAAGNFTILAKALQHSGLLADLKKKGPLTVFAPTDEAFAQLPQGMIDELMKPENAEVLKGILAYHVIVDEVTAAEVATLKETSGTLQGQTLDIVQKDGKVFIGQNPSALATITKSDIKCSNGVIHVIDRVMLPRQ